MLVCSYMLYTVCKLSPKLLPCNIECMNIYCIICIGESILFTKWVYIINIKPCQQLRTWTPIANVIGRPLFLCLCVSIITLVQFVWYNIWMVIIALHDDEFIIIWILYLMKTVYKLSTVIGMMLIADYLVS